MVAVVILSVIQRWPAGCGCEMRPVGSRMWYE